jgi:hypothetical protein
MYRPIAFRLAAALLALSFGVAGLDSPVLHACPLHDALPVAGASAGMTGMTGMAGMAAPAGHAPAHGAHVHGCTCLGSCCAGAASQATPAGAPALAARVPAERAFAPVALDAGRPRGPVQHFLPFAHAPPLPA